MVNKHIEQIIKKFSDDTQQMLRDNLVAEYLFGSLARNETSEYSDIDILIIVKQLDHQIRKRLSELSSEYCVNHGVYISPIVKDTKIWEKNKTHKTLFYEEIERDGVRLC